MVLISATQVLLLLFVHRLAVNSLYCKIKHRKRAATRDVAINQRVITGGGVKESIHFDAEPLLNNLDFLHSLKLESWGSFRNVSMNMNSTPAFIVITGKSGTGKSVLISAFEHLVKTSSSSTSSVSSREIFSQFSDVANNNEAVISVIKGDNLYRRRYNVLSKKSLCDIDGKKSTIKAFVPNLPVRFWFRDSLKYIGSGDNGVVNYINDMVKFNEESSTELSSAYKEWKEIVLLIKQLEGYENNMSQSKSLEINMLRHFVSEVESLQSQLLVLFDQLLIALETLQTFNDDGSECYTANKASDDDHDDDSNADKSDDEMTQTATGATVNEHPSSIFQPQTKMKLNKDIKNQQLIVNLVHSVNDILRRAQRISSSPSSSSSSSSSPLNFQLSWSVLQQSDRILNELSSSFQLLFHTSSLISSSAAARVTAASGGIKTFGSNSNIKNNIKVFTPSSGISNKMQSSQTAVSLSTMLNGIDSFMKFLEHFQTKCNDLGLTSSSSFSSSNANDSSAMSNDESDSKTTTTNESSIFQYLETAQTSLHHAKLHLLQTQESFKFFQSEWPDLSELLLDIEFNRLIWDNLARKHNVTPMELQMKYNQWLTEIHQYDNLDTLLPQKRQREKSLRMKYCQLAAQRTVMRVEVATKLVSFVNNLLPQLEMGDKKIVMQHSFRGLQQNCFNENDSDGDVDNFDSSTMQFTQAPLGISIMENKIGTFDVTIDNIINAISNHIQPFDSTDSSSGSGVGSSSRSTGGGGFSMELGWDNFQLKVQSFSSVASVETNNNQNEINNKFLSIDTLSSGEKSRLALALETCCLEHDYDQQQQELSINRKTRDNIETSAVVATSSSPSSMPSSTAENSNNKDISLIVFDELDAHVGGEAAVAIARLLKKQGKYRQVIAVTHNPVIAAAADMHFLVSRCSDKQQQQQPQAHDNITTNRHVNIMGELKESSSFSSSSNRDNTTLMLGSTVEQVTGVTREWEIARMATGALEGSKGLELAQELLNYDFNI